MSPVIEEASPTTIPLVDLSGFTTDSPYQTRVGIAQDLVRACQTVGFAYIRGHGIPQEQLDKAFAMSKQFFDLSLEQKMKAPHPPGWAVHRGYSWPGLEKVSGALSEKDDPEAVRKLREVMDYKESYEVGSDHNPAMPNIWLPEEICPEFRPFMTQFYWTCFEAAATILRALSLGIGFRDEGHLLNLHSGHFNQLRILHYPAVPASVLEEGTSARMPAHTDWSTITILFQDECGGLQVENPRQPGTFIDVGPVEGTLVMNVGDLMMRWSNDKLISTSHRVSLPPLQDRFTGHDRMTRERYSIPYFLTTDPDLLIECMPTCVDEQHPAKYEAITQRNYSAMRARMQY